MIRVEVVYSPGPGRVDVNTVELPEGSTLAMALSACAGPDGWLARHGLLPATAEAGVWGRRQPGDYRLCEGDRVEIYRPLQCDPKEARRRRHRNVKDARRTRAQAPARPAVG